MIQQIKKLRTT